MDLILWRHAEAEEGSPQLDDGKRRLTPRGEKQAHDMARWLKPRLPKKLKILVSPANRTQQTAHALGMPFEIEPRIAVGATAADLIHATGWPAHAGAVLLVGHQPTLGQLSAQLLASSESDWSVKKGGLWWFSHRVREDQEKTILRAVINPDMLR